MQLRQVQAHPLPRRGLRPLRRGGDAGQGAPRALGHIELAVPVVHIWFFKSLPSRIGHLLGMRIRDLERVIYYESYVVIEPGNTGLKKKRAHHRGQVHRDRGRGAGLELRRQDGRRGHPRAARRARSRDAVAELRKQRQDETSVQRKKELLKRLRSSRRSAQSQQPSRVDGPRRACRCIPPDLRPLVPLEGGRFATSDLNDLYRRVINRNNRLKKLMDIKAPGGHPAQREAHAAGGRRRAVRQRPPQPRRARRRATARSSRCPTCSRASRAASARTCSASASTTPAVRSSSSGPELKLHQCGLPKNMALELFKPFIIRKLEERGFVQTVKSAKKLVERETPEVWDILEEIIEDHPVLLNRAPTLHRLGIQAFEPVLVEGKAIRIHPLVCTAFNADFDGDQMAVHVPLSFEAQIECQPAHAVDATTSCARPTASPIADADPGHRARLLLPDARTRRRRKGAGKTLLRARDEVRDPLLRGAAASTLHVRRSRSRIDGPACIETIGRAACSSTRSSPRSSASSTRARQEDAPSTIDRRCYRIAGNERTCVFLDTSRTSASSARPAAA